MLVLENKDILAQELHLYQNIDNKFTHLILSFIDYLRGQKFSIDTYCIINFFKLSNFNNMLNKDDLFYSLKCLFCKNKFDENRFKELFDYYFYNIEKEQQNALISQYNKSMDEQKQAKKDEILKSLEENILKKQSEKKSKLTKKDILKQKEITSKSQLIDEIINQNNINKELHDFFKMQEQRIMQKLMQNLDTFDDFKKEISNAMIKNIQDANQHPKEVKNEIFIEIAKFVSKLLSTAKELTKEVEKEKESAMKEIEKLNTLYHRKEFLKANNAVRCIDNILDKDIGKLDSTEYQSISNYIKLNASKFRTKISRTTKVSKKKIFDYKRTIQKSVQTYGDVVNLCYKKPIVKKTKIVCMIDVSGSISKYAKMLLYFVYELSSVFKGGVKSFIFIKDLLNVSNYLSEEEFNVGYEKCLKQMDREYSDYGFALRKLYNDHIGEFDSNTIFIILGDARNNKNYSGIDELKKIKERCKEILWLVPEDKLKWNTGDSYISEYSTVVKNLFKTTTMNDIIHFVENLHLD